MRFPRSGAARWQALTWPERLRRDDWLDKTDMSLSVLERDDAHSKAGRHRHAQPLWDLK